MKVLAMFCWIGSVLGVFVGGFIIVTGLATATAAPQEAVVICLGLSFAILPYCLARAVTEIAKID